MVGIVLNYCQRVDMLSFMVDSSKGEPSCCFINDSVVSVVLSFPGLSFGDSKKLVMKEGFLISSQLHGPVLVNDSKNGNVCYWKSFSALASILDSYGCQRYSKGHKCSNLPYS